MVAPAAMQVRDLPYELIELGKSQALSLRLERDGYTVIPDSGTVTVTDPNGDEVVTAGVIVPGELSTFSLAGSLTEDYGPAEGWGLRWDLVIAGEAISYQLPAILVLRKLTPRIGDSDIRRRYPHLDGRNPFAMTQTESWQPMIDDAWRTIQLRLIESGRRPWLISDYAALTEPHILLAAARIHETLSARGNTQMSDMADRLHRQYELAFSRSVLRYAEGSDGREQLDPRKGAAGQIRLVRAPRREL